MFILWNDNAKFSVQSYSKTGGKETWSRGVELKDTSDGFLIHAEYVETRDTEGWRGGHYVLLDGTTLDYDEVMQPVLWRKQRARRA